ncbi:MAG: hypothetical protein MH204_07260 [Fimbriimonadaceae bacterium]|nr:hypothetical protein [Fimbriimonadaceae bacterium]
MKTSHSVGLSLLAGLVLAASSVPDVESAQRNLSQAYEALEQQGAYVVGSGGVQLGRIKRGTEEQDLGNRFGSGSEFRPDGLFNRFSKFGDGFQDTSAFSSFATKPPEIRIRQGRKEEVIGVLTLNVHASVTGQKIDPRYLKIWLGLE